MNGISQTQVVLYKLKTAFASPNLLISELCSELINRVDIASEVYLTELKNEKVIREDQTLLINEIRKFEAKCLSNAAINFFDPDLSLTVNSIEAVLNNSTKISDDKQISELNNEISRVFSKIKTTAFSDRSIIFLKRDCEFFKRYSFEITFLGVMFVIEDMYIDDGLFESGNHGLTDKDTYIDFDHESMKIHLLKKHILSLHSIDNLINYVRITPNKVNSLDFRGSHHTDPLFHCFHSFDMSLFDGLRNLTNIEIKKVKIKRLHPDIFQGMNNLKILDLNKNQLTEFDFRLLRNLKSLEFLGIRGNEITEFDSRTFQGLLNLKNIELSRNKLSKINEKTFKGLKSLKIIYLSANRLTSLDTNIFQGLDKLSSVHIDNNELSYLSPDVFKGLKSLHTLGLSGTKLTDENYRNIKRQLGVAVYDSD